MKNARPFSLKLLCIFAFALAAVMPAQAQDDGPNPNVDLGLKPYESFHGGDIDSVSMANGNLIVHIPLLTLPQRGKLSLGFSLVYNNKLFRIGKTCTTNRQGVTTCKKFWELNTASWSAGPDNILRPVCGQTIGVGGNGKFLFSGCKVIKPDQSTIPMGLVGSGVWRALDGSGIAVNWDGTSTSNVTAFDKEGTRYTKIYYPGSIPVGSPDVVIEDPNGNTMSLNFGVSPVSMPLMTDSLGRNIPSTTVTTDYSGCTGPLAITSASQWMPPGLAGGSYPIKFCSTNITLSTPPAFNTVATGYSGVTSMLQSVVLPNGTAWTFEYDAYGDLSQITLPTGGTISYTWTSSALCPLIPSNIEATSMSQVVASRTLNANDGQGPHSWTYGFGQVTTNPVTRTDSITDPVGNETVYTETGLGNTCSFYEANRVQYQGSQSQGVVLKSTATTYAYGPNNQGFYSQLAPYSVFNVLPTSTTITLSKGKQNKVTIGYDAGFSYQEPVSTSLNPANFPANYGNTLIKSEYDYGSPGPGPLLRTTTTNYQAFGNSSYLSNNLLNLPSSVQVKNGSGTQVAYSTYGYDAPGLVSSGITTQHDASPPDGQYRGNQTSVSKWLNTPASYLTSNATFLDTGEVQTATDPKGNKTTYAYSSTYEGAYLTSVTNAMTQSTTHTYDFNTGLLSSTTNPNNQTSNFTYDIMLRLASASYPDGGSAIISVQESTFPFTATLTKKITASENFVTTNVFDGFGRVSQSQLTSDPSGTDFTDTNYDALGRKASVSNPYRTKTDPTYGVTSYVYDGLGRTCVVIPPDGTAVSGTSCPASQPSNDVFTVYSGNQTTVTDQQGKSRKSQTDGLGRLTAVWEDPAVLNYETDYTYDALDDLVTVVQGGSHNRSFVYDSLKRLTSSTNPEAGTVIYTYDGDSNVLTKKDARSITTTYAYDALNRMTGRTYANGDPSVSYTYDQPATGFFNVGHRTGMTDSAGSESWKYDSMGRELSEQRTTNAIPKSTAYTYNLDSSLATLTYPSGRVITYTIDTAERPISAVDSANTINYATSGAYAPQSALSALTLGSAGSFTGINLSSTYNTRLQPSELKAWSTAGTAMDLTYGFADASSHNNGNVMGITNNKDTTRTQQFTYDSLNRILTAKTASTSGGNCWGLNFAYDQWANLTAASVSQCTAPMLSVTAGTNNQLTTAGFSYDASGNVLGDTTNTYAWNAESEIKAAAGVNYTYDGDGDRIQKSNGKIYWYGTGAEILDESDASGNITDEYVYFGGKRIAHRVVAGNSIYYYAEDFLGSSRVMTTSAGTVCYDADFYPFGGERVVTNTCPQNYKFEGKERDTETNNDDFGARYYSSQFGRWTSPDWSAIPAPVPYADLTNPQTLNLYAMVHDNPETFADLNGHCEGGNGALPGQTSCGSSTPASAQEIRDDNAKANSNSAAQVLKDTAVGFGKEVANEVTSLANAINAPIDAGLAKLGINFSFGQGTELQAGTPGEKGAMIGTSLGLLLVPVAGEEKAATKIGTITADAEKLYPKLAGKFQEHHIIPQYLGGAKDGATARIPAAYHQLITNEFRALAPYGQKIQRTAEEVGRILQQVYSKYPLP